MPGYDDTIESEISTAYYGNMLFRYVFAIVIIWPIISGIYKWGFYPTYVIIFSVYIIVLISVHIFLIKTGFITGIIASPECLTISYICKPQRVVDYKEIESINNFKEAAGFKSIGARHAEYITLKDGSEIVFSDQKFQNYVDLKNHIFRYMVDANQRG